MGFRFNMDLTPEIRVRAMMVTQGILWYVLMTNRCWPLKQEGLWIPRQEKNESNR